MTANQELLVQPTALPQGMVIVELTTTQGKYYQRLLVQ
jgi:hypothetical protein